MRAHFLLAASSFGIFTFGAAFAHQDQAKPAEQVFKNIQSFKGEPASSILPAMQFMCASLKVDCEYCHVQDKSSDEKEEKGTARKMIAMTKAINDANFGGRMQITCATCHAGHTHPMNLPPVEGADLRPRRAEGATADKVLADYDAATGAANVESVQLDGEATRDGKKMPFSSVQSKNEVEVSEGDMRLGYNGSNAWIKRPDGTFPIPPEVTTGLLRVNYLYCNSASLPKLISPRVGTAQIDGKDVYVLSGQVDGSKDRASLYFDKGGLLARIEFLQPTILGYIPEIISYSNYRRINGIEVPMKISVRAEVGDENRIIKTAKINAAVDASVFEQPK